MSNETDLNDPVWPDIAVFKGHKLSDLYAVSVSGETLELNFDAMHNPDQAKIDALARVGDTAVPVFIEDGTITSFATWRSPG